MKIDYTYIINLNSKVEDIRKKMNDIFGDENFILNDKNGYSIN